MRLWQRFAMKLRFLFGVFAILAFTSLGVAKTISLDFSDLTFPQALDALKAAASSVSPYKKMTYSFPRVYHGKGLKSAGKCEASEEIVFQIIMEHYCRNHRLLGARDEKNHLALMRDHEVIIITQNVDDLHERAGSTRIIHLHGELVKARGTRSSSRVMNIGYAPINIGDMCPAGSQLRPHIVWFGEAVPAMSIAEKAMALADVVLVIGTSLQVYPAAGLVNAAPPNARRFLVDSNLHFAPNGYRVIAASAEIGVPQLTSLLET